MSKQVEQPAFPLFSCSSEYDDMRTGMSLRDYFAAKAMQGIIMTENFTPTHKLAAKKAYEIADSMLAERSREK